MIDEGDFLYILKSNLKKSLISDHTINTSLVEFDRILWTLYNRLS